MKFILNIFLIFFSLYLALAANCPEKCNKNNCLPPVNCFAGFVKDKCGCCYVCGQLEGQRCYDKSIKGLPKSYQRYPSCGELLECKLRDDLAEGDQLEAICACQKNEPICGSDGITYENQCKLTEARYKKRDGLTAISHGPCKIAPKITSPPSNIFNYTNANVAITCEALGYPIPTIEWYFIPEKNLDNNVDSERGFYMNRLLPSDDPHIAVQSRGGPNLYEVTSWLQILKVQLIDNGFYHCVAKNSEGEDAAFARLKVLENYEKKINTIHNEI